MKSRSLMLLLFLVLAVAGPASAQKVGSNWRVYNVKPSTSSFWDINKPQPLTNGLLQFPVQQFVSTASGSFAVYLLNNYNFDMTNKEFSTQVSWTDGTYTTRSTDCIGGGAFVRFEFQDVTSGPYDSNDYWWSTDNLDLNGLTKDGTLTASLADRTHWTNQAGRPATDTTVPWTDWTGVTINVSPYDGFTNAVKNVKQAGLSFGSACRFASGIAVDGGTGTFEVLSFTLN